MLPAWSEPRATSAIADIRGFIGMVLDEGYAYQAGGAVYFEVARFPKFGQVSHYTREQMLEFAAERGGNVDDPNKRDPLDFVLVAAVVARRAGLGVAVGPGSSRLAHRVLGAVPARARHHDRPARWRQRPDLPAPRVRGRSVRGRDRQPLVRHWMHQAMVRMDGEKMSKSLGNLVFVSDLLETGAIRERSASE